MDWSAGDPAALQDLTPLVYDELRRLAARQFRRERRGHTLQTTALAHEAYLRLIDQSRVRWQDREHFFAVAAQTIRRILVDHARSTKSQKRGGGRGKVTIDESLGLSVSTDVDLVALDDALESLSRLDPQQGRIVELRYFGGLTIEGTATVLSISTSTVTREWALARAWLRRELLRGGVHG
jgi:RNA polymerase sigma factor (TIGR02999 family)